MLKVVVEKDYHSFEEFVLGKAKYIRVSSNILLDSDQLVNKDVATSKNEKL